MFCFLSKGDEFTYERTAGIRRVKGNENAEGDLSRRWNRLGDQTTGKDSENGCFPAVLKTNLVTFLQSGHSVRSG